MKVQRWNRTREAWRPAGELIDPTAYFVEPLDERRAKTFVETNHYSRSYPAARFRVGLFERRPFFEAELVGVAVFSVPMQKQVVPRWLGVEPNAGVERGRFVLLDRVPGNGETWFLARAFEQLRAARPELRGVVSYSDPVPRRVGDLTLTPGHVGTIYQAFNGRYLGRSSARRLLVARDGTVISGRSLSKVRNDERGRDYAEQRLVELGAEQRRPHESGRDWVARVLAGGAFTGVSHPGNHVYVWGLDRRLQLAAGLAYPKLRAA